MVRWFVLIGVRGAVHIGCFMVWESLWFPAIPHAEGAFFVFSGDGSPRYIEDVGGYRGRLGH